MKKYKCEFKFQNVNSGVYVSIFFYLEGDEKYNIEKAAIITACNELNGQITDYQLNYYRCEVA